MALVDDVQLSFVCAESRSGSQMDQLDTFEKGKNPFVLFLFVFILLPVLIVISNLYEQRSRVHMWKLPNTVCVTIDKMTRFRV